MTLPLDRLPERPKPLLARHFIRKLAELGLVGPNVMKVIIEADASRAQVVIHTQTLADTRWLEVAYAIDDSVAPDGRGLRVDVVDHDGERTKHLLGVIADRERELRLAAGPCGDHRCRLHHGHGGSCIPGP